MLTPVDGIGPRGGSLGQCVANWETGGKYGSMNHDQAVKFCRSSDAPWRQPAYEQSAEKTRKSLGVKVLSEEPPKSGLQRLKLGEKAYVNDGSCPKGQIKEMIGTRASQEGFSDLRGRSCVTLR